MLTAYSRGDTFLSFGRESTRKATLFNKSLLLLSYEGEQYVMRRMFDECKPSFDLEKYESMICPLNARL